MLSRPWTSRSIRSRDHCCIRHPAPPICLEPGTDVQGRCLGSRRVHAGAPDHMGSWLPPALSVERAIDALSALVPKDFLLVGCDAFYAGEATRPLNRVRSFRPDFGSRGRYLDETGDWPRKFRPGNQSRILNSERPVGEAEGIQRHPSGLTRPLRMSAKRSEVPRPWASNPPVQRPWSPIANLA